MAELRAYQPSFTAGELSPALWARVDLSKYASGLKTAINLFIHPHGGASNRAGTEFIGEVKNSAQTVRMIPFQFNADQSYVLEFGHNYMRVYKEGAVVLSGGIPYELATPYVQTALFGLVFVQEADVMYITHRSQPPQKLSRFADDNWTIEAVSFAPKIDGPATVTAGVQSGGGGGVFNQYKVAAIDAVSGEESLPTLSNTIENDLSVSGHKNTVEWDLVPGASRYIIYKDDNGIFGYIGGSEGYNFTDDNITPDLSDTPQTATNPFDGVGKYPRCAAFVEQRLAFGATVNEPQGVWLSQSANYENFGVSFPAKPSDAVTFRIRTRQVNEIRAMLPIRGLMLLTSGSEWVVSGGSQDAISPSAIRLDNQGYRGCATVQPVVVGSTVLFAQSRGGVIRDFSYQFADDSFVGKDLTILARHLFERRSIKSWAYAQAPYSIVWVVLDDGSLVSLTYLKEHDVWAWTRHESAASAAFEDVVVVGEGNEDVPYFIVRRTIDGATKRYIERLHTRYFDAVEDAFFVDCGLSYSGAPATVISGLGHLVGQQVVALADGNVVRDLTVSVAGSVTLPNAASKVHVGLPYEASLQTLDLDLGQIRGIGTVQGRSKSVSEVVMRVQETRGIFVGPRDAGRDDSGALVEYKQRDIEAWNEAIKLYTGDIHITPHWDWSDGGNVWVKQFDPLPMTILAIMPDVTIGR